MTLKNPISSLTRSLLIASAAILLLPIGDATAAKPGGGGGGGGGGKPSGDIELCMTIRDAAADGLISDGVTEGAFTECYDKRNKHYVMIWGDAANIFHVKDHGNTPVPRFREIFFTDCATDVTGLPCVPAPTSLQAYQPINTQHEYVSDGNGGWTNTGVTLDFAAMAVGAQAYTPLIITNGARWGDGPNVDCGESTPALVTRVDADNWIIETDSQLADGDVTCRLTEDLDGDGNADPSYFHAPFRIDLQRK